MKFLLKFKRNFTLSSMSVIKVGDRVKIPTINATGEVAFIGQVHFSKGLWLGVILDTEEGRCNGSLDGICYFKCPNNRGIFVRAGIIEKEFNDTRNGRKKQHQPLSNRIKNPNDTRGNFKVTSEKYSNLLENKYICKMPSKNEDYKALDKPTAITNENKSINKSDTTYVINNSSSDNRIKYPNYLKASSKISYNHICEAKNIDSSKTKCYSKHHSRSIHNNKFAASCKKCSELDRVKNEIEELKNKLKETKESQQEILIKFDRAETEIKLLKRKIGSQKKQMNYQEHQSKLLELGYFDLCKVNNSFVNIFDEKLHFSGNMFDLNGIEKRIEAVISRQMAALDKQCEKQLQKLLEITECFKEKFKPHVKKMNYALSPSNRSPPKFRSNSPTSAYEVIKKKALIREEFTYDSKENIDNT